MKTSKKQMNILLIVIHVLAIYLITQKMVEPFNIIVIGFEIYISIVSLLIWTGKLGLKENDERIERNKIDKERCKKNDQRIYV